MMRIRGITWMVCLAGLLLAADGVDMMAFLHAFKPCPHIGDGQIVITQEQDKQPEQQPAAEQKPQAVPAASGDKAQ